MRFNDLLHLAAFPGKAHGRPPASGFVIAAKMPDSCALSKSSDQFHPLPTPVRSLAEDFDTATATGKLHLTMVLAFSEWWRNSIRERSVAGQAKARAEGRFPGRRPSLSERQREYIRAERSKGVSQRELAKRLEVSRWTIQQADR